MSHKSFWASLGDTISFIIFIKYGLPILIVLIIGLVAYQGIYGTSIDKKYESMENVIVTSELVDTVCDYAREVYNREVFSKVEGDPNNSDPMSLYSVEVDYVFNDNTKTAEEYDALIKEEITKLYNKLKGKVIEKDQIFAETERKSIGLSFYIPNINGGTSILSSASLIYRKDSGFVEESYKKELNRIIVTSEKIEDAIKRSY